jgi:hypothetical protein
MTDTPSSDNELPISRQYQKAGVHAIALGREHLPLIGPLEGSQYPNLEKVHGAT